jgi:membrane-associated phospholipid phosphatase
VPKSSGRPQGWLLPLLVLVAALLIGYFTPRLPGDPVVARTLQSLGIGPEPAAWITSLVMRPASYVLLAIGLLVATWRGRLRGLVTTVLLMALWWYVGEPLKAVMARARPTPEFVQVVQPASGYAFPSTFATAWFSVWVPVAVYAWRTRQRSAGLAIAIAAGVAIAIGAWARVRLGAHWPSDLLLTLALVWASFALIERIVERVDTPA